MIADRKEKKVEAHYLDQKAMIHEAGGVMHRKGIRIGTIFFVSAAAV